MWLYTFAQRIDMNLFRVYETLQISYWIYALYAQTENALYPTPPSPQYIITWLETLDDAENTY